MKKRICILLSLLLILPTVLSFPVFAESTPSLDTLVAAAKDADQFASMLEHGAAGIQYAVEKGYVDTLHENKEIYENSLYLYVPEYDTELGYYPFTDSMNSFDKWREEVKKYFTEDRYGLVPEKDDPYAVHFIEHEGKTYSVCIDLGQFYHPVWETAEIVTSTSDTATIAFEIHDGYHTPAYGKYTVTFEKHTGKWLVSGGTYFGLEHYLNLSEEEKTLKDALRVTASEFEKGLAEKYTRIATPSWSIDDKYGHLFWELIELTDTTAIFDCCCRFNSDFNHGPLNVEFTKTANGWQVSGGSYFEVAYEEEIIFPPAQTGDSAVYALWIAGISLLALGALLYRKKKI